MSASAPGSTISSTLWAHLLNNDAGASGSGSGSGSGLKAGLTSVGLTASTAADRTGTSVRVLLHDTQATIEKFSEKVDKLVSEAEDSHRKLLARNEEVSGEVERLVRRAIQEQGRAEAALKACISEPAQAPALAELRQSISGSVDALNQKVEAIRNLALINTQALQSIKDQQLQILTAIIPLLPMLQKVPLCIAYTEANLKEAIRKSLAVPTTTSVQPLTTNPTPGPRKRRNPEQHSPSPSVAKKRRTYADSGCTTQQLPSPKSSRDSLLTQGGLPTSGRFVSGALHPASRSASRSVNSAKTPNSDRRLFTQPPTPRAVPNTPSRMHPVTLPERDAQPAPSPRRKKETASETSVVPRLTRPVSSAGSATPVPSNHLNHLQEVSRVSDPPHIQTPLRTGSKHPDNWSARPSAPPPPSVGFSARRGRRFIPINDDDSDDNDDETRDD